MPTTKTCGHCDGAVDFDRTSTEPGSRFTFYFHGAETVGVSRGAIFECMDCAIGALA